MSRASVRAAAALYLGGRPQPTRPTMYRDSAVTLLGTLWSAKAREVDDDDYWPMNGQISGAVAFVHLVESIEQRDSFGGGGDGNTPPAGLKKIEYRFYLEAFFKSKQQRGENAQADYDTFLDSLVARMRADRTWGTGGQTYDTIWAAGENIQIATGEPDWSEQRFYAETAIMTTITEWVQS